MLGCIIFILYTVYIYISVYIYTHIYTHIYTYIIIYVYSHTHINICMHCFLQMKSECKQKKTDLTYLYWAHSQWNLHHHWNIQLTKRCHLSSGMWRTGMKGKEQRKKKIRYLQVKTLLQRQVSILEKKCFRIVTFKTFKLYQAFRIRLCNCALRGAGFPCQRNSASPGLLNILGVRRRGVPAGLCRLAGAWHRTQYVQRATAPAWLGNASYSQSRCVRSEHAGLLDKYHYHIGPARRHLLWLSTRRVQAEHAFGKENQVQDRLR